jgi:hypothetical protein
VGATAATLAQLKSEQAKSELRKASHGEQIQLTAEFAELDKKIANYDANNIGDFWRDDEGKQYESKETKLIWKKIGDYHDSKWEKIGDPTVTISLPSTPAKECLLAARHLLVDKRERFEKADQARNKLARDITALQTELPRWRRLLFFFSGNGRLLNKHRFICFLSVALVLSCMLLYLSSGNSTEDLAGPNVDDGDGAGSVYGMLLAHCDHVPTNSGGAYFDFWTIWVLITAYCGVSALFVSRILLHDLAQELVERVAGCICFICRCGKPTKTRHAGQLLLLCCLNVYLLTRDFTVLLCTLKLPLQV